MLPKEKLESKGTKSMFVRDHLEETILTLEEQEDLENNYEVICKTYTRFGLFSICGGGSGGPSIDENNGASEGPSSHQIQLQHRNQQTSLLASTIAGLVNSGPPSSWNNRNAINAYKALKVNTYIVDPNYLVCSSLNGDPHLSRPTMDVLLQEIGGHAVMPSWASVKDKLLNLSEVYDKCEDLPSSLDNTQEAQRCISKFLSNLSQANACPPTKFKDDHLYLMNFKQTLALFNSFGKDLLMFISDPDDSSERFVHLYISTLLSYFFNCLQLPVVNLVKQRMTLHLGVRPSKENLTVNTEPGIQLFFMNKIFLIGEIKGFGYRRETKHPEKQRDQGATEGQSYKDKGDGLVLKDKGREGLEKNNDSGESPSILSTGEVESLATNHSNISEQNSGDASIPTQHRTKYESAGATLNPEGQKSSGATGLFQKYRDLDAKEEYKVSCFLPQLLVGMLSSMKSDGDRIMLGAMNENVQFGIAVEGFKLRFVRLVLCADTALCKKPTVADIGDARVRCEVFLTQELNLFKRKHVLMLFQLLFGISYVCQLRD